MNTSTESKTPVRTPYSATYSPDDNKLRLYSLQRLPSVVYARLKRVGFRWAPKQQLFVAPMWTPEREDLLIELCGEIDDEDTSLVDRAEERAERFEFYSEKRAGDAEVARAAVAAIADNIPLGQPILVGHHSERHARKDAERIENGMRRAVRLWETSKYWTHRAAGAIRHAKYKERPDVRQRRIKALEADQRKQQRRIAEAEKFLALWQRDGLTRERALAIANYDHVSKSFSLADYPRQPPASQYEGPMSLWSTLDGDVITAEQAREIAVEAHREMVAWAKRWLAHLNNRLEYERALLADGGGTAADQTSPEAGGACVCWASPRGGWSYIQKVNRISVTVLDNWGNGGGNFTRTIAFDKLSKLMTAAQVQEKRAAGLLVESEGKTGFFLRSTPSDETKGPTDSVAIEKPQPEPSSAAAFDTLREQLKQGVQVVSAPQLFITPPTLAARMVEAADIQPGMRILEPSAGTGNILAAIPGDTCRIAVELNQTLANATRLHQLASVHCADFLQCNGELGQFDRILMNPPFADGQDVDHVSHALGMLKPGGRLVAIMSAGVTFRQDRRTAAFRALVESRGGTVDALPAGSFKVSGTEVSTVLVVIDAEGVTRDQNTSAE